MLEMIKTPFVWIAKQWDKFEHWVASIAPGVKTKLTAATAFVGNTAFLFKDYIDQLPMEAFTKYLTADVILGMNLILLTLIYWFKRLSDK